MHTPLNPQLPRSAQSEVQGLDAAMGSSGNYAVSGVQDVKGFETPFLTLPTGKGSEAPTTSHSPNPTHSTYRAYAYVQAGMHESLYV